MPHYTIIIAALLAFGVTSGPMPCHAQNIKEIPAAKEINCANDFTLTDHFGKKMRLCDYKGKVVLLFFGFTFCPDICPTGLIEIDTALEELGDRKDDVQVLFISVDPERDTPEILKEFVTHFNSEFIGLTGTPPEEMARIVGSHIGK